MELQTHWDIEAGLYLLNLLNGVPYAHQGRDSASGLDCAGVVFEALHGAGWVAQNEQLTYNLNYTPEGCWQDIEKVLDVEGYKIPKSEVKPLDVLLIHWRGQKIPQHFAVVNKVEGENIWITHTHESLQRVASCRVTTPLERRIFCYYRFRGRIESDTLDPLNN